MAKHTLLLPILGAGALSLCACAEPVDPSSDPGSLRMGVVGQDDLGNIYRLRDGVFDIDGPETTSVSTETSPIPLEALTVELAAGNYDITLNDGWQLERWDPITDESLDVVATLVSENPASALVTGTETSTAVFSFVVPDAGPVTLGDGDLEIEIDVDIEDPVPDVVTCDPLSAACVAGEGCYPYTDAPEDPLQFGCFPVAVEGGLYDVCEFINTCASGLSCWSSTIHNSCDVGEAGCCLPFCDVSAPTCAAGDVCLSVGAEDADAGVCTSA